MSKNDDSTMKGHKIDPWMRGLAEKLCAAAPDQVTKLISQLEVEAKIDTENLVLYDFINACRETDYLGDECGA